MGRYNYSVSDLRSVVKLLIKNVREGLCTVEEATQELMRNGYYNEEVEDRVRKAFQGVKDGHDDDHGIEDYIMDQRNDFQG